MNYVGGKTKYGKKIWLAIKADMEKRFGFIPASTCFVDIMCGGCNVIKYVTLKNRIANDLNPYIVAFMSKIVESIEWLYTENFLDKDMYNYIKKNIHKFSKHYVGYIGYNFSKNSIFFGGFKGRDKNYAKTTYNSARRDSKLLQGVQFYNKDYREVKLPPHSIIYCDIPYKNTIGYDVGPFDYVAFFEWVEKMTREGHYVYISEYNKGEYMPVFCEEILRFDRQSLMSNMVIARAKKQGKKMLVA